MQDNPYAKYTQPTAPQAPAQTAPAFIPGTVSPVKQQRDARADALAERRLILAQNADRRADLKLEQENQDRVSKGPVLTKAQEAVDKEFGKEYVAWNVAGGFSDFQKQATQLAETAVQLGESDDITGPVVGRLGNFINSFVNPDAISTREDVEEVVQRNLRLILGAQFTEKEGERLIARAYNPNLQEGENKKRVERLLKQMRDAAAAKQDAISYYEENGTIAGWKGKLYSFSDFNPEEDVGEGTSEDDSLDSGGLSFSVSDDTPSPYDPGGPLHVDTASNGGTYTLSNIGNALGAGLGDIAGGLGDIAGIVGNPLNATINSVFGTNLSTDLGSVAKAATGLPEGNQTVSTINRAATGALTFGGLARGAGILATSPLAQGVLGTIGRTPIRDTVAGAGAGAGMVAGNEIGGPVGGVLGTVAGGLAGYKGANTAVNAFTKSAPTELANIAARQKVDLLPADVGGPAVKGITTGTKASPLSVGPVVKQAGASQNQMRQAVNRITGRQGEVIDTDAAGESIRAAGKRFTKETSQRGSRLYEKAGKLAKGVTIKPRTTIAALDGQIAEVKANPAAPPALLKELETFKANIEGGVSVLGLRNARTTLSQGVYDGKLRSGPEKALYKQILGNLSDDIQAGLHNAGRGEAADAFKRADTFWKARVEHIDEVLQPILGKDGMKGGEDVVMAVESMARGKNGGNARLSRLLGAMSPEEAGNVRAVLIDRIGRATPGKQSAEGAEFSPSTFLTNWNRMTPQGKASLFAEPQLRRDLTDIATLAEKMKATEAMANHSNTGMAVGGNAVLGTILGYTNPLALGAGASVQYSIGKLMASPRFARMLARTTELPERVQGRKFIEQLGVLAAREPAIAADARGLQQHLQQTIGQSPATNLAAEEQN